MITRRLGALLIAGIAAPALASCSFSIGGSSIDQDKLATSITDHFNKDLQPLGHSVTNVDCDDPGKNPDDGTEFKCVVTAGDTDFNVTATVAEPDVKFEADEVLYDMPSVSTKLTTALKQQVPGSTVDCGTGLRAVAPDDTFTCPATLINGKSGTVVYFVTKGGANDRWELK